jgi:hypothetical protein
MRCLAAVVIGLVLLTEPVPTQAPQLPGTSTNEVLVVAGERFGRIRESTTRAGLESLFPRRLIRDGDVNLGEGFCAPGTVLFPGTVLEAEMTWQDAARSKVAFIRASKPGAPWVTSRGVRIGTALTELERLAGKAVTFSGFGWDYGGGLSWEEPGGRLRLRLSLDPSSSERAHAASDSREIFGDRDVRSDHPLIRTLTITVFEITQTWGPHHDEHDCA